MELKLQSTDGKREYTFDISMWQVIKLYLAGWGISFIIFFLIGILIGLFSI